MYKFTGHETFPCRYAWLPKAFAAINADPTAFADDEQAMVVMGVGKNMVRAIRFWVQAADIAIQAKDGSYALTRFGYDLLSPDGFDPYLEDIRTLWLIHWKFSTQVKEPLFAWDYMLNKWPHPEITSTEALQVFEKEAARIDRKLSTVTLQQHFDTFLHTYVPTRSRKGDIQEDNLDSPFVELDLIHKIGERAVDKSGKREAVYAFRREEKPEITPELFIYCLNDFWNKHKQHEKTLSFRDVALGHGSPGQIFKLPESSVRERMETIEQDSKGAFTYQESAALQQVIRTGKPAGDLLAAIFAMEEAHV
jgi:hypothetical protein